VGGREGILGADVEGGAKRTERRGKPRLSGRFGLAERLYRPETLLKRGILELPTAEKGWTQ